MPVEKIETTSVEEFWGKVSPIGEFHNKFERPIYRGHGDAEWPLIPSALREDVIEKYCNNMDKTNRTVFFEYRMLSDFVGNCDKMSYALPRDTEGFREMMESDAFTSQFGKENFEWPSKEFYPILALAQHHGIPTRLLDWSKNSFVAMYFAASQALRILEPPSHLCVWCFDSKYLDRFGKKLEIVNLPGSISKNFAAQRGIFTLHRGFKDVQTIFDESLSATAYQIRLPTKFCGELMMRCNKFEYSAATLFPDFTGAADAALEFITARNRSGIL